MIESFRHRGLKRLYERGDESGIRPDWLKKVKRLLDYLDAAEMPDDLDLPGSGYHGLTGDMVGRYALTVSRNWRITFAWSEKSAVDIDMEDYHG